MAERRTKIFNYLKGGETKDSFIAERLLEVKDDIIDLLEYAVDNSYPKTALILVLRVN